MGRGSNSLCICLMVLTFGDCEPSMRTHSSLLRASHSSSGHRDMGGGQAGAENWTVKKLRALLPLRSRTGKPKKKREKKESKI